MARYYEEGSPVDAYLITGVTEAFADGIILTLDSGAQVRASSVLIRHHFPRTGDYWVVRANGTIAIVSSAVFDKQFRDGTA